MISYEDCVALCGLDANEVAAIAEHEHIPAIAASALANYLVHKAGGEKAIKRMIVDDIKLAIEEQRPLHAVELLAAFRHFLSEHPHALNG
jgi:hypothetical protein